MKKIFSVILVLSMVLSLALVTGAQTPGREEVVSDITIASKSATISDAANRRNEVIYENSEYFGVGAGKNTEKELQGLLTFDITGVDVNADNIYLSFGCWSGISAYTNIPKSRFIINVFGVDDNTNYNRANATYNSTIGSSNMTVTPEPVTNVTADQFKVDKTSTTNKDILIAKKDIKDYIVSEKAKGKNTITLYFAMEPDNKFDHFGSYVDDLSFLFSSEKITSSNNAENIMETKPRLISTNCIKDNDNKISEIEFLNGKFDKTFNPEITDYNIEFIEPNLAFRPKFKLSSRYSTIKVLSDGKHPKEDFTMEVTAENKDKKVYNFRIKETVSEIPALKTATISNAPGRENEVIYETSEYFGIGTGKSKDSVKQALLTFDISKINKDCSAIYLSMGCWDGLGDHFNRMQNNKFKINVYGADDNSNYTRSSATHNTTIGNKSLVLTNKPLYVMTNDTLEVVNSSINARKMLLTKINLKDYITSESTKGKNTITLYFEMEAGSIYDSQGTPIDDLNLLFSSDKTTAGASSDSVLESKPRLYGVNIKLSENNNLKTLSLENGILDKDFDPSVTEYNVTVTDSGKDIKANYELDSRLAFAREIKENGKYIIEVVAESGNVKTYTFNIVKPLPSAPTIQYVFKGTLGSLDPSDTKEYIFTFGTCDKNMTNTGIRVTDKKGNKADFMLKDDSIIKAQTSGKYGIGLCDVNNSVLDDTYESLPISIFEGNEEVLGDSYLVSKDGTFKTK